MSTYVRMVNTLSHALNNGPNNKKNVENVKTIRSTPFTTKNEHWSSSVSVPAEEPIILDQTPTTNPEVNHFIIIVARNIIGEA